MFLGTYNSAPIFKTYNYQTFPEFIMGHALPSFLPHLYQSPSFQEFAICHLDASSCLGQRMEYLINWKSLSHSLEPYPPNPFSPRQIVFHVRISSILRTVDLLFKCLIIIIFNEITDLKIFMNKPYEHVPAPPLFDDSTHNNHDTTSYNTQPRPPSITLRSSAKQLVSTTSTAPYYPLQSTQLNGSTSKEPIVLVPHRNHPSPLKPSSSQPGITLISNSPNLSLRSIPPSSRVLIRPSSSASNLSNIPEYKPISQQILRRQPLGSKQPGDYTANMMNAMKVELQQMTINFSNRLYGEIQKQNEQELAYEDRQIMRLEKTLRDNENLLRMKDQEIEALKESIKVGKEQRAREIKSVDDAMEQNHEYLCWKARDINLKVSNLVEMVSKITVSTNSDNHQLMVKVDKMMAGLNSLLGEEMGRIRSRLDEISNKPMKSIFSLESKMELIKLQVSKGSLSHFYSKEEILNTNISKVNDLQQVLSKLSINHSNQPTKQHLSSINRIKETQSRIEESFKYLQKDVSTKLLQKLHLEDEFKLLCTKLIQSQTLLGNKERQYQNKIQELQQHIGQFQAEEKKRKEEQAEYLLLQALLEKQGKQQKLRQEAMRKELVREESQLRMSQSKSRMRENVEKRVPVSEPSLHRIPSVQSIESLNVSTSSHRSKVEMVNRHLDTFNTSMRKQKITHSMKHLVQSQQISPPPRLPAKLINLQNLLRRSSKRLPFHCEIDSSGILKQFQQGTYIFDQNGDVFTLSESQQKQAIKHKLIYL